MQKPIYYLTQYQFLFDVQINLLYFFPDGPYTVFAPSNNAFKKLGDETLQRLGKDQEILTGEQQNIYMRIIK